MHSTQPQRRVTWLLILLEGSLAVLAWGLGLLMDPSPWEGWRWDARDAALGVAVSVPMLLLFWLCVTWPVGPLVRIRRLAEEFIRPLFVICSLAELAALSLAAGVGEEMFFRGVLQEAAGRWTNLPVAVAAVSVAFGLLHALTPTYAVLATLLGVYLGAVQVATGNLLVVIIAHALYDFVALVYLVRVPPSRPLHGHHELGV
jgi:membrane protease YdiL (CAAX protease family)